MALTSEQVKNLKPGDPLIYNAGGAWMDVRYISPTEEPEVDGEGILLVKIVRIERNIDDGHTRIPGHTMIAGPDEVSLP